MNGQNPKVHIFQCPQCDIKLTRKDNLQKHIRNIHLRIMRFECHVCSRLFSEKGNLNVHLRTHTGVKPYKCDQCYQVFSAKGNLSDHLNRHYKQCSYECMYCSRGFQRKFQLKCHIMQKHKDQNETSQWIQYLQIKQNYNSELQPNQFCNNMITSNFSGKIDINEIMNQKIQVSDENIEPKLLFMFGIKQDLHKDKDTHSLYLESLADEFLSYYPQNI